MAKLGLLPIISNTTTKKASAFEGVVFPRANYQAWLDAEMAKVTVK